MLFYIFFNHLESLPDRGETESVSERRYARTDTNLGLKVRLKLLLRLATQSTIRSGYVGAHIIDVGEGLDCICRCGTRTTSNIGQKANIFAFLRTGRTEH
jgi:hypothetical protein